MDNILRALALLAQIGLADVPPVAVADAPREGGAAMVNGFVLSGDRTIYVTPRALKKDARELAAIIAHERVHVLHGRHEAPAYDEQLRVLEALGVRDRSGVRAARALHARDYPAKQ